MEVPPPVTTSGRAAGRGLRAEVCGPTVRLASQEAAGPHLGATTVRQGASSTAEQGEQPLPAGPVPASPEAGRGTSDEIGAEAAVHLSLPIRGVDGILRALELPSERTPTRLPVGPDGLARDGGKVNWA